MSKRKSRQHKYGAIPTVIDGIRFASKAEARRYQELTLLERNFLIKNLELQPSYQLIVNDQKICRYIADFRYTTPDGIEHIEDVKGIETPMFKLKRKLMKACLNLDIEIIK